MTQLMTTISLGAAIVITAFFWVADESGSPVTVAPQSKSYIELINETDYEGVPPLAKPGQLTSVAKNACPHCSTDKAAKRQQYPCQLHNIKQHDKYKGIEVESNRWIRMACDEAHQSVKAGDGPFGAVIVQVDDETNHVIRYWRCRNQVTRHVDPTAHAEVTAVRNVARELGVFNLGQIRRDDTRLKLPQPGLTSHCEIYSSCEPCPMCYAAIRWARIDTIVFSATRFDAAEPGVDFSDLDLYQELATPYRERERNGFRVFQATTDNSLDAFNLWKNTDKVAY
ncbi:nucleoside deaminase [Gimesia algae]|uniref:Guanine deaminase n=1 Tax=Gimesia algae TaxID=2527971 RepID=A0A517VIX9_9PLAN|nr:nucleoside deaminase [Gimesia algae]QDT92955.1 Guanine deaminase [Gimesia algae]